MPSLVPHVTLSAADFHVLRTARVIIPVDDAVFRVEGPGAIACLQGLLTNDVSRLTVGVAIWGAFLTPKGMIVSDAWLIREGDAVWVVVPAVARATMQQLFARTMPPRLARVSDVSATHKIRWLCGGVPAALDAATIARPDGLAPFTALLLTPDPAAVTAQLIEQGWIAEPGAHADAVKALLGWPTLGREIDERTLPQEVRFDELGGVRYDKGCYTGQETVARLHFRGHANRTLRGVRWAPGDGPTDDHLVAGDKAVGTLRTIARFGDEFMALAVVRRDLAVGAMVRAGDAEGELIEPPFDLGAPSVA